jgi:hypothetical protein
MNPRHLLFCRWSAGNVWKTTAIIRVAVALTGVAIHSPADAAGG